MDIPGHLQEIAVCIDNEGFVSALIEMACSLMSLVEGRRIGDIEMAHELLEVGPGRSHDDMEMVGHEDKGEEPDVIDFKGA